MSELLTIGEVSRRSGVAASALRYYGERGLISSERAGSGHRRYRRPVLRRIAFIVFAQHVGLTLEEIGKELDKLPENRVPSRRDWSGLSGTWTSRIDDRIAELERLKLGLTECSPVAACRWTAANWPIPATGRRDSARGRTTGLETCDPTTGPSRPSGDCCRRTVGRGQVSSSVLPNTARPSMAACASAARASGNV